MAPGATPAPEVGEREQKFQYQADAEARLCGEVRDRSGRPVKMLYSRSESLVYHPKRHATVIRIATGAQRDGTLTFDLTNEMLWPLGKYKVELFINDELAKTVEFEVR